MISEFMLAFKTNSEPGVLKINIFAAIYMDSMNWSDSISAQNDLRPPPVQKVVSNECFVTMSLRNELEKEVSCSPIEISVSELHETDP